MRELLQDSRVKVNVADRYGITPLCDAASTGFLDIITWWIASGREMDLGKPGDVDRTDAIGGAKKYGKTKVVTLLERFKNDASKTRHAVRVELGLLDKLAEEMFALVVFVSDEILRHHSVTCSQVLLHCHPAPTGAPDGVVPSRGGIRQGYRTRQGERSSIQVTGKEASVVHILRQRGAKLTSPILECNPKSNSNLYLALPWGSIHPFFFPVLLTVEDMLPKSPPSPPPLPTPPPSLRPRERCVVTVAG